MGEAEREASPTASLFTRPEGMFFNNSFSTQRGSTRFKGFGKKQLRIGSRNGAESYHYLEFPTGQVSQYIASFRCPHFINSP
ncbi:hypothetical protein GCM10011378_38160 [Hymenobacter glacieicola]|uniref:Uncharacterized protein n=1 Tax=Hymenobacter glacieicola TaxID=1562124 RepID=A0ABQ1X3Q3_9BACT|nr:hypothetical protein GCM10011378_38160 [Hymenobacter glacieicola]